MPKLEDELGDIVGKARIGNAVTPQQLAQTAGLSVTDISDIEGCRMKPSGEQLAALARALSLDAARLAPIADDTWAPSPPGLSKCEAVVEAVATSQGGYGENCYIVACPQTRLAAIVDPGGSAGQIRDRLAERELTPEIVLITHAHFDHTGGLRDLVSAHPGIRLANHLVERDSVVRGLRVRWEAAHEKVPLHLGSLSVIPLSTAGHTPGSVCYHIDGVCLVGDTLFAGSIGRPAGHEVYRQMLADIRCKVLSLPDQTVLLPGHGPVTSVAEEKAHNPFF